MNRLDGSTLSQVLAQLVNLVPGFFLQIPQWTFVGQGGGYIERLHAGCCREMDRQMHELGFQYVGPLTSYVAPGWVLRGFSHPVHNAWAVHYVGLLLGSQVDFVTEFCDGHWLTTTSQVLALSMDAETKPIQVVSGQSLAAVWARHLSEVKLQGRLTTITGGQRELVDSIRRYFRKPTSH